MTDDDIVPETLQRFDLLAAGRSWDPAAMHAAQKAQDFRFFLHYWMEVLYVC